jgi:putative aldouronate transport system substrate-binding protein
MRKSTFLKLVSIILAAALLVSMAACGSSSNTAAENSTKSGESVADQSTETTAAETAKAVIDPLAKYDTPITLKWGLTKYTSTKYRPGESETNNVWINGYKNDLGINVEYLWVVNENTEEQKLDLAIASGDIPDVMSVKSRQFEQLLKEDLIQPVDDVFANYVTPLAKEWMTEDGITLKTGIRNGKLMGFSGPAWIVESSYNMWIRQDWLTKLGLAEPKTFQDVLGIAEAFVNNDPDGNGKNDTLGFLVQNNLGSNNMGNIDAIMAAYHAYMFIWQKDASGKLVYSGIQPQMKTALSELQKFVKAGLISKEFALTDGGKAVEIVSQGKAGIDFGAWWNTAWPLNGAYDKNPNAEWKAYPIMSADEQPAKPQTGIGDMPFLCVRKGYEHPEVLGKLISYFVEKGYGENAEFDKYIKNPDGKDGFELYQTALISLFRGDENTVKIVRMQDALKNNDASKLDAELKAQFDLIQKFQAGDKSTSNWVAMHHYGPNSALPVYLEYKNDKSKLMIDEKYGPQTPTMISKQATLRKIQEETIQKIMLGADITEFDKFVDNWKKLGGDQITQEVNEWYTSINN